MIVLTGEVEDFKDVFVGQTPWLGPKPVFISGASGLRSGLVGIWSFHRCCTQNITPALVGIRMKDDDTPTDCMSLPTSVYQ